MLSHLSLFFMILSTPVATSRCAGSLLPPTEFWMTLLLSQLLHDLPYPDQSLLHQSYVNSKKLPLSITWHYHSYNGSHDPFTYSSTPLLVFLQILFDNILFHVAYERHSIHWYPSKHSVLLHVHLQKLPSSSWKTCGIHGFIRLFFWVFYQSPLEAVLIVSAFYVVGERSKLEVRIYLLPKPCTRTIAPILVG